MKILILNTYDAGGGAARAASRLHKSLLSIGVDSHMLVQLKSGEDDAVSGVFKRFARFIPTILRKLENVPLWFYPARTRIMFSPAWVSSPGLVRKINAFKPDVVHLHWSGHGFLRPEDLLGIDAPLVWSLHDNWAFTGGCHIKWECRKHIGQCGACPILASGRENDLSRWQWSRKHKVFSRLRDLQVIGLSRWLADEARSSSLFRHHNVINLPNPIDCSVYKPLEKSAARQLFNLPQDRKLVMFGAFEARSDINKGFAQLQDALQHLQYDDAELVMFGCSPAHEAFVPGFVTHYPGRLHDDVALSALYSAADVIVVPSLQENLSNTIMEALACGTPVVAFAVGGNADLIEHQRNGYLATAYDTASLAAGIDWVLGQDNPGDLSRAARSKVENDFEMAKVARRYESLYRSLLGQ